MRYLRSFHQKVLILVLMDDALRQDKVAIEAILAAVLILVLMDDALRQRTNLVTQQL